MAKYVFLNIAASGHVNPTLALVQELVHRGQQVSYYLTEEFREVVQATGATFHSYTSSAQSDMPPPVQIEMADEARLVPPQIIDRIRAEQPDAIIYDYMCVWAREVIEAVHVPAIATRATYASNEHFHFFRKLQATYAKDPQMLQNQRRVSDATLAVVSHLFSHAEKLNIIFITREFQPAGETFDERFLFVGPAIARRDTQTTFPFERLQSEHPLLYISLGSIFTNKVEFYQQCFEAFGNQPWQVVLSIGKKTDQPQLGPVPENFVISPYVPQLDILSRTQVFVTHAGMNSVMESLYYGVPMVLIPQQAEQQITAHRVADLGAGLALDGESLTAPLLREAAERVVQDASFREQARHMQEVTHAAGGQQRAVEAIMQFTEARRKQASKINETPRYSA